VLSILKGEMVQHQRDPVEKETKSKESKADREHMEDTEKKQN